MLPRRIQSGNIHYGMHRSKAALQASVTKSRFPSLQIGDTATVRTNSFVLDTYVWSKSPIDGSEFWAWDVLLKGGIIYCGRWRLSETYPNNTYKVYAATIAELDLPLASTANAATNPIANSWQQREPVLPAEAILLGCPLRWSFFGAAPLDRTTERTFLNLYAGTRKLDVVDNFGSLLLAQNPAWSPVAGESTAPLTVEGQITSIYQFPASVPNWTTRAHNLAVTGGQSGGTTASSVPQSDYTSAVTTFAGDVVTDQVLALKGKKTSNDGSNWVVDQFVLSVG